MTKKDPKRTQRNEGRKRDPKMPHNDPKRKEIGPQKRPQKDPKRKEIRPQKAPKRPKKGYKGMKGGNRTPKCPKGTQKGPQRDPKPLRFGLQKSQSI